jgi:hypothetical protein
MKIEGTVLTSRDSFLSLLTFLFSFENENILCSEENEFEIEFISEIKPPFILSVILTPIF